VLYKPFVIGGSKTHWWDTKPYRSSTTIRRFGPGIGSGAGPLNILSNPANTSSGIAGLLANNPSLLTTLGLDGAAVGLGLFESNQPLPYQSNLTGIATELNQTAGTAGGEASTLYNAGVPLVKALTSGQLPPGAQKGSAGLFGSGQCSHEIALCLAGSDWLDDGV
jgi:hypothetical protein